MTANLSDFPADYLNPPETIDDVLGQLERSGLIESAAALRLG